MYQDAVLFALVRLQPWSKHLVAFKRHYNNCLPHKYKSIDPNPFTTDVFGGTCCLQLQGSRVEAASSSDTLVRIYQSTRRHIPEDSNLQNKLC
jgi:hypothetical protein